MSSPESLVGELAFEIKTRVGKVGSKIITLSRPGMRRESIGLSRGGVVIPNQPSLENYKARRRNYVYTAGDKEGQLKYPDAGWPETPVYVPDLSAVTYLLGDDSLEGLERCDPGSGTLLDGALSRNYAFMPDAIKGWRAYDAWGESWSGNYLGVRTFFLDAAKEITDNEEELLAVKDLLLAFDKGVVAQGQKAVDLRTGLIPQHAL